MVNDISSVIGDPAAFGYDPKKATEDPGAALTNKDTFLKLLVAQIRNQDPLQPQADGESR